MKLKKIISTLLMTSGILAIGSVTPMQILFHNLGLMVQTYASEDVICKYTDTSTNTELTFTLVDKSTLVISGTGCIPSQLINFPQISEHIDNITSLKIEEGITSIDSYAFRDWFYLNNIDISNTVETIGYSAFIYCGEYANSKKGEKLTLHLGNSVKTIGGGAFRECGFGETTITLPYSVKTIGTDAFNGSDTTIIVTSDAIRYTEEYPFGNVRKHIKEVQCYPYSRTYAYSEWEDIFPSEIKKTVIYDGYCGDNLKFSIYADQDDEGHIFDSGVGIYGYGDMYNYSSAEETPWSGLYESCSSIGISPDANKSITSIGDYAFSGLTNLCDVSLTFDKNFSYIGKNAFSQCPLSSVTILGKDIAFGADCFYGTNTLYCFKNSSADIDKSNIGCDEKKYIVENATLDISIPIKENNQYIHKVGISVTNDNTTLDRELTNYSKNNNEYKFTADMYINEFIEKPLSYETYYIYNYANGDYDKQIADGSVNDSSSDDKSNKEKLFKKIISKGTIKFTLKDVE